MSTVSSGTKALLYRRESRKNIGTDNLARDNLSSYAHLHSTSLRYSISCTIWRCRRVGGRTFCSSENLANELFDFSETESLDTKSSDATSLRNTESLITGRDLKKGITAHSSFKNIVEKLSTLKRDSCGKYINLTKEFLCDSDFLRLAYDELKNNQGILATAVGMETLGGISNDWFEKATDLLKHSRYEFTAARQTEVPQVVGPNKKKRILTITNDRDKVVQKAIALLLELIYEGKKPLFLEVSHGFRSNRSCHTALRQIKYGWSGIP